MSGPSVLAGLAAHAGDTGPRLVELGVDPLATVSLLALGIAYARGRRALGPGARRALGRWRVACFSTAVAALALALLSPLDALAGELLSMHMTQHVILVLVAAPLLVAGAPVVTIWAGAPARARRRLTRISRPTRRLRPSPGSPVPALAALVLSSAALWVWHLPDPYEAALANPSLHALEHATFLGTAVTLWWALTARPSRPAPGVGVACLFLAALQCTGLGVLMATSSAIWYPAYFERGAGRGVDPLADQQVAGVIMWMPGGLIYAAAAALLLGAALREPTPGPRHPAT